ncbi:MAG: PLP-dependent aminotransferase family protein [Pseudomonadota bacterium]
MVKRAGGVFLDFLRADPESPKPLYRQIYQEIRKAVLSGRLQPGTRLPSTRTLSKDLGVSRTTLRQSFDQLIDEGYLDGKTGYGTFVPLELARAGAQQSLKGKIKEETYEPRLPTISQRGKTLTTARVFGSASAAAFDPALPGLDLFPASLWARVAARRWRRLGGSLLGYDQPGGYRPLRHALAQYLRSARGLICDEEQIIVTAGAMQTFTLLSHLLLDPGDQVWIESPGIISGRNILAGTGAQIIPVPCDRFGLDISAGVRLKTAPKMVHITPSRHYPLGYTMPLHRRLELLSWAHEHNAWVIENDYDSEFRFKGAPLPALQGLDRRELVIYTGSFGKTLFPGLRLSYLVVPPRLVQPFQAAQLSYMPCPVPIQAIVADFINEGHYTNHVRQMRMAYSARESALAAEIKDQCGELLSPEPTGSGFHFLAHVAKGHDPVTITKNAKDLGIVAYNLASYYLTRSAADNLPADTWPPPGENKKMDGIKALVLGFACLPADEMGTAVEKLRRAIVQSKKKPD